MQVEFIKGKDGVIIGAKLKAGNGLLEQPVPHLYPLELSCDKPAQFERKKGLQSWSTGGKTKGLRVKDELSNVKKTEMISSTIWTTQ